MKIKPIPKCCNKPMVRRMRTEKGRAEFYFECLNCGNKKKY